MFDVSVRIQWNSVFGEPTMSSNMGTWEVKYSLKTEVSDSPKLFFGMFQKALEWSKNLGKESRRLMFSSSSVAIYQSREVLDFAQRINVRNHPKSYYFYHWQDIASEAPILGRILILFSKRYSIRVGDGKSQSSLYLTPKRYRLFLFTSTSQSTSASSNFRFANIFWLRQLTLLIQQLYSKDFLLLANINFIPFYFQRILYVHCFGNIPPAWAQINQLIDY